MSGGYVNKLNAGEHLVVVFTFKGPTSQAATTAWNTQIRQLKRDFELANPGCVIGVTIKGEDTPAGM